MPEANLATVNMLVYGQQTKPKPPIEVTAGALSAWIEPDSGQLRYVKIQGVEVLRGIYGAVRDSNWGTIVPVIENLNLTTNGDGFECVFGATHTSGDIRYAWVGTIRGHKEGWITYQFEGQALSDFDSNRVGLCILHPDTLAGHQVEVVHLDGTKTISAFPNLISPELPFRNEASLSFEPFPGLTFSTEYSGENFSTEDQRNWTDASYKTYSHMPGDALPYSFKSGEKFSQKVRISISGSGSAPSVVHTTKDLKLPSLGTLIDGPLTEPQISQLKSLGISHVAALPDSLALAEKIGPPVFLVATDAKYPDTLSPNDGLILYPPTKAAALAEVRGGHRFAGSFQDFTDLNNHQSVGKMDVDGVAFAVNAQVHAFDSRTIQESAWIHGTCTKTAKSFTNGKVFVGPIRIKPRGPDSRTSSLISIGFALASIRTLAEEHADYACYFTAAELLDSPSLLVFDLLRAGQLVPGIRGEAPTWVALQAKFDPEGASHASHRLLVSNQTPETHLVDIGSVNEQAVMQVLDASNVEQWRRFHNSPAVKAASKFSLGPYGFAVVHWTQ